MAPDVFTPSPLDVARAAQPSLVPGGVWLTGEDSIRVTTFNSLTGVTLACEGVMLLAGRGLTAFAERHVPNTDRTSATSLFQPGEGWLQRLHVRATAGAPRRGQCFAMVELVRGRNNGNVQPIAVLAQGYVTDTQRRGWPDARLEFSSEGPGNLRALPGTDPGAGVEITETVPTNARWRLLAFFATLVTDATVANRAAQLLIDNGSVTFFASDPGAVQAASATVNYASGAGVARAASVVATQHWAIPDHVVLPGGYRFRTSTVNLQAGDNWSAPAMLVEEWIED